MRYHCHACCMILKNRVGENEKQSHEVQQNEILDTASRMLSDYASAVIAATFIRYAELVNYSLRMNKRTRDCAPLSP